ncbi:MAG: hypothetical protein U0166_13455 [Acidobacteriota bacterium]
MAIDPLLDAAVALTLAVEGIDWDAEQVRSCIQELAAAVSTASRDSIAASAAVLVDRLERSTVEDADGVAHVAITAGTLVEHGAPAGALGEVLLTKLPALMEAARRYADRCLADLPPPDEEKDEDGLLWVDRRAIPEDVFRTHLATDRPGAAALYGIDHWVLPTVAVLTRDRDLLLRACHDARLRAAASRMVDSDAHWIDLLLGVELDALWLAVCPIERRAFRIAIDGIVSNFDLHALLAAALTARGIPGEPNPPEVMSFIRGDAPKPSAAGVRGTWNLYTWQAASFDLSVPSSVPHSTWVWGEGRPHDVPAFDGSRTLLVGPQAYTRSWALGRPFSALPSRVAVQDELPTEDVDAVLTRMRAAAEPPQAR